ncbi:cysteine methyltransferase [Campylobacter sp. MIT 12-8780]|nr:methylated-DNA--[protein]-cysteine S-methyltransferase [Campylobacter sp. MIT 19-121]NDJ27010.1 methylated-DNA--[protein]-cysteine S-methyltransferase [Campylobacter sp. MIT 19-121]TQR41851.1 cysteine methyltransferase [Campylobacter sp. MIT 12-8780]
MILSLLNKNQGIKVKGYYQTNYASSFGDITLACDGKNLIGLWLESQKHFDGKLKAQAIYNDDLEIFKQTKAWLKSYFKGEKPAISELSLAPIGTEFRQRIWQILCEIPYAGLMTYGDIAKIIAKEKGKAKMSAQAVGSAVGHNPISIIIPCHRVVGANGNLTGYAGGIQTKIKLLEHEGVDMKGLFIPKNLSLL